jgi:two-component system chemotaxis response regulator CheB
VHSNNRNARQPLKVLVVDDSAVVRQVMTAVLSQEAGMDVAVAADPIIAIQKIQRTRPDVIVLDLEMPRMHGLDFLRKIMTEDPLPVVVCSALTGTGTQAALRALEEGAVEIVTKPRLGVHEFLHESAVQLIDTVRGAAEARVVPRRHPPARKSPPRLNADAVLPARPPRHLPAAKETVVAVGASTGGTEALRVLLQALPPDTPPFVIVQHMPAHFTAAFAERLNQICRVEVKEAADGDQILTGRALIAPGDRHLIVGRGRRVRTVDGPLVSRHRPSVDVLFRSVAQFAGSNAVGVLMTGMGDDGAAGLLEMKQSGASTIVQDEGSCVVFGMPQAAIALGAADVVVSLAAMPNVLAKRLATKGQSAAARGPRGRRPAAS